MKTSESIKTIAPLLLKAQMEMGDVKKGSSNPFFNSSYADLNSVREASIPVLNSLGITVLQPTVVVDGKNYVETLLLHSGGEWISSQTAIVNDKGTAQAEGSGLSYARRYGLQSLLNIGAVDDDAESATKRSGLTKTTHTADTKPRSTFRKAGNSGTLEGTGNNGAGVVAINNKPTIADGVASLSGFSSTKKGPNLEKMIETGFVGDNGQTDNSAEGWE